MTSDFIGGVGTAEVGGESDHDGIVGVEAGGRSVECETVLIGD
jgi:hypothetical protein